MPAQTHPSIRCGHCYQRHNSPEAVYQCFAEGQEDIAQAEADYEVERRTEEYYESRGYAEARAQERRDSLENQLGGFC